MKTFKTRAGEVEAIYKKRGQPLLILLHGLQGSKELFSSLIAEPFLSKFDVLVPDLPGFGGSAKPADFDYRISSFTQIVHELITDVGHREAIIIGHSLGGMIGTKLLESKLVNGLLSLEGNLTFNDCGASKEIAGFHEDRFVSSYLPLLEKSLRESKEPSATFRLEAVQKAAPYALYRSACDIVSSSRSEELFRIFKGSTVKKQLFAGERSSFASRALLSKDDVTVIPDAGHFLLHDNYKGTIAAIKRFIAET